MPKINDPVMLTLKIPPASFEWLTKAAQFERASNLEDFILISAWRAACKTLADNQISPHYPCENVVAGGPQ